MTYRVALFTLLSSLLVADNLTAEPIDIGSRRELFVDDFLIDSVRGAVRLQLHRPIRREIALETDAPWEGNASCFQSVFKDGDLYRMYYRGTHYYPSGAAGNWHLCYAESDDGIHWRRPELDLVPWKSKPSNIILVSSKFEFNNDAAHTAVFKDPNPDCLPGEKYKMVAVGHKPHGIYWLGSPDGIRFSPIRKEPFMTKGAFDSQNLAFFDVVAGVYREYHRGAKDVAPDRHHAKMMKEDVYAAPTGPDQVRYDLVRWIMTSTSKDLYSFSDPEFIPFPGAPIEELYTNTVQPYYRAPHIFMGFPARYVNRGWSEPVFDLPGLADRLVRTRDHPRYGPTVTDAVFMTSRDGVTFKRWPEAFIRPGPREKDSWVYGDNYVFWGMVETKSTIEDAPNEISLYATEGYWQGKSTSFRRLTLRLDGFVSAQAPLAGGEIVTKPIRFEGGNLTLNLETSTVGSVQVEIQDADGKPIDGYALADCPPIFCDRIAQVVRWTGPGGDVRPLSGRPVRLRFVLKDADLYSFQFVPYAPDPQRPSIPKLSAEDEKEARDKADAFLKKVLDAQGADSPAEEK